MGNKMEPKPSEPREMDPTEVTGLNRTLGLYSRTFRRNPLRPAKERIDAEEIIKSLTVREEKHARGDLSRLITWQLSVLANFALLILLLNGLGTIRLPTWLIVAVIVPLLSSVLGLLGLLVKHLTH
jgi:hypothetical protein